jgi:hypothetical protein
MCWSAVTGLTTLTSADHTFFDGRVIRLGEFSPLGRLLSLGSFLKMAKVDQILGLLLPTVKAMY